MNYEGNYCKICGKQKYFCSKAELSEYFHETNAENSLNLWFRNFYSSSGIVLAKKCKKKPTTRLHFGSAQIGVKAGPS